MKERICSKTCSVQFTLQCNYNCSSISLAPSLFISSHHQHSQVSTRVFHKSIEERRRSMVNRRKGKLCCETFLIDQRDGTNLLQKTIKKNSSTFGEKKFLSRPNSSRSKRDRNSISEKKSSHFKLFSLKLIYLKA